MDEQITTKPAAAPMAADKGALDLSGEIERTVAREPQDRVRCVRVYDDHYRCNWWAPGVEAAAGANTNMAEWASVAMHTVRKSRFITARLSGGQLVMEEAGGTRS